MLLSPVFFLELVRSVRRPRFFTNRTIYGGILLGLLLANYSTFAAMTSVPAAGYGFSMASFGQMIFFTLESMQYFGVIAFTPSQVAPSIAEEKQRKRLQDLLITPLSSTEIVLGKLGAKLLTLMTYVALGLPVVSLLTLVGGVDPLLVLILYAGMFSTAFFLGSVAIMCSVFAPKVRTAVSWTYTFLVLWLVVPTYDVTLTVLWPGAVSWVEPINAWIKATNPFVLVSVFSAMTGQLSTQPLLWMIGLQLAYGAVFLLIAIARLRPAFRNQEGRPQGVGWRSRFRRWRLFPPPPCGDDPILWKEKHTSRTHGLTRLLTFLIHLGLVIGVGFGTVYFAHEVFQRQRIDAAEDFNLFLCVIGVGGYIFTALGAATAAAGSVTSEREATTWTSLISTPLSAAQVVRGKLIGALWRVRLLPVLVLTVWIVGVIAGALDPLALVLAAMEFTVFVAFAVAIGLYLSVKSPSTSQAQSGTSTVLVLLNLMPLCCLGGWPIGTGLCTPWILALSLFANHNDWRWDLFHNPALRWSQWLVIGGAVVGVILYALGAVYFTYAAIGAFETAADRPRRSQYASMPVFTRETLRKNQEIAARSQTS